ncbi:unnamed protein product [Ilex paraguariensis]|uniref:Amidase domain-containing protein n=1 Tax=Ilex paraguariensis TaxID=185542 RepID=A0ABC8RA12_9AQUA
MNIYTSLFLILAALSLSEWSLAFKSHELSIREATVQDLQKAFKQNQLTSRQLVEFYIKEINKLNPVLKGIIEVNPDALCQAEQADQEREVKSPRSLSGLHGIPILLKDNIATKDKLNTTSGSLALLGSVVPRDAGVVMKLRNAGAIILGKASLSEWANFRTLTAPNGWSARGGQGKNPYVLSADPCGSSSGSAIAVAANLVAVSLGTETGGSIICPASFNAVVGIKPTVGLTSRAGVIPISPRQDTIGTNMIRAENGELQRVSQDWDGYPYAGLYQMLFMFLMPFIKCIPHGGYTQFLKTDGLKGKRLGIVRNLFFTFANESLLPQTFEYHFQTFRYFKHPPQINAHDSSSFSESHSVNIFPHMLVQSLRPYSGTSLAQKGAVLVDSLEIANIDVIMNFNLSGEATALLAEFKLSLNAYLKELVDSPVRSLADIIAFNQKFSDLVIDATKIAQWMTNTSRVGELMMENRLDALVTAGPCVASVLAIGGFPGISVHAAYNSKGVPVGICFGGLKGSEPKLIEIAYSFDQATKSWKPPTFQP